MHQQPSRGSAGAIRSCPESYRNVANRAWCQVIDITGLRCFDDPQGYNLAALLFFFLFSDNLLRRIEGQGWKGFWPCSGRFEVVVLFGILSLVAQLVYWSRIVIGLNEEHA